MLCVDPNEERTYEIDGGRFKIGVLPKDVYAKIMTGGKAAGFEEMWLAVKHGVRGHDNLFFDEAGQKPVPFKTVAMGARQVVSDETLMIYHSTEVLVELASEVIKKGNGEKIRGMRLAADRETGTAA